MCVCVCVCVYVSVLKIVFINSDYSVIHNRFNMNKTSL